MSSEIVKRALELNLDTEDNPSSSTLPKKNAKRGKFVKSNVLPKKARIKSVIEEQKEKSKLDCLKRNLRYLHDEKNRKTNLETVKKLIDAFQKEKSHPQYWKEKRANVKKQKRAKMPCVFTDEDFARIAAPQKHSASSKRKTDDKSFSVFNLS